MPARRGPSCAAEEKCVRKPTNGSLLANGITTYGRKEGMSAASFYCVWNSIYICMDLFHPLTCVKLRTALRKMTKEMAHKCMWTSFIHCTWSPWLCYVLCKSIGWNERVRFLLYGASVKKCDGLENLLFRWEIQEKESIRLRCKNIGWIMSGSCSRAWKSGHRCIRRRDLEHFCLNAGCKPSKLVEVHYKFYRELFHPRPRSILEKPDHLWKKYRHWSVRKANTKIACPSAL